jgi:hypothetical protein
MNHWRAPGYLAPVLRAPWKPAAAAIGIVASLAVIWVALAAIHLLPQLRNPFAQTTSIQSGPVILKSITALSRYEAASGTFQVVIDLSTHTSFVPSFIAGSQTLFIGDGTVVAYVDFGSLHGRAIQVNSARRAVTVRLPAAALEAPVLNVDQSYVFAQQQGLINRVANFFSGNPNSQQAVYISADQRIAAAARSSGLVADAERNTREMLTGMLATLGFQQIAVLFAPAR